MEPKEVRSFRVRLELWDNEEGAGLKVENNACPRSTANQFDRAIAQQLDRGCIRRPEVGVDLGVQSEVSGAPLPLPFLVSCVIEQRPELPDETRGYLGFAGLNAHNDVLVGGSSLSRCVSGAVTFGRLKLFRFNPSLVDLPVRGTFVAHELWSPKARLERPRGSLGLHEHREDLLIVFEMVLPLNCNRVHLLQPSDDVIPDASCFKRREERRVPVALGLELLANDALEAERSPARIRGCEQVQIDSSSLTSSLHWITVSKESVLREQPTAPLDLADGTCRRQLGRECRSVLGESKQSLSPDQICGSC